LYNHQIHAKFTDYDEGMKYAAEKHLPVIVDFTGFGCVNCRKMEAAVWINPQVKNRLENDFVLISLYVDDRTPLAKPYSVETNGKTTKIKTAGDRWSYLQSSKFNYNAQPFYVALDNNGKPLNTSFIFDENPDKFLRWLNKGKENYR
jgi:thiol:disulfide interchange protein DsbD